MRAALLVVDVQRDFCPGGSLAVEHGDDIVPKLNKVIIAFHKAKLPIFFSRDWYPRNHCSFKSRGGTWPVHCVAGTAGAKFHPGLVVPAGSAIVSKATKPDSEAYSAFQGTGLGKKLNTIGVKEVFIGGLATDYCVRESALDALATGLKVTILRDCVKGVNIHPDDSEKSLHEITSRGAVLLSSAQAIELTAVRPGGRHQKPRRLSPK